MRIKDYKQKRSLIQLGQIMICEICDLPNELQSYILSFLGWNLRNGKWIAPIAETKKQALLEKLNKKYTYTYSNSKIGFC